MALWSSSAAMVSVIDALNRAYDIEESAAVVEGRLLHRDHHRTGGVHPDVLRPDRGGPVARGFSGQTARLAPAFSLAWKILQWPIVFLLASTGFGLVYYFAPDAEQEWVWITPGALTATLLWLVASLAFRFYVVNFGNYEEAYGTLGAIILTLLWFYISGSGHGARRRAQRGNRTCVALGKNPGPRSWARKNGWRLRQRSREWFRLHPKT